jgi:DNA invertase Pin-like site-specific DNA recombinase
MMNMLGSFSQFERDMIPERTKLGLARARAAGRKGGGKHILSAKRQAEVVRQVMSGEKTQAEAARDERVSKATISRKMNKAILRQEMKAGLV